MDIKAFFSKITSRSDGLLHTPYGDFNLAKAKNPKTVKSVVIGLQAHHRCPHTKGHCRLAKRMADGYQCRFAQP